MEMDSMLLDMDVHTENMNIAKNLVIDTLFREGVLTEKQKDLYSSYYNVILYKNKWFDRLLSKFKSEKPGAWKVVYVQIMPMPEEQEEEEVPSEKEVPATK